MPGGTYEISYSLEIQRDDGSCDAVDVLVTYTVDGRDAPARWCQSLGCWDPPEYASAEVLDVQVLQDDGTATPRPELIAVVQADRHWESEALAHAAAADADAAACAAYDAAELEADWRREKAGGWR